MWVMHDPKDCRNKDKGAPAKEDSKNHAEGQPKQLLLNKALTAIVESMDDDLE